MGDEPFIDLERCITAATEAAASARKLALDNPEQAERHRERELWYLERARQWRQEMERADA